MLAAWAEARAGSAQPRSARLTEPAAVDELRDRLAGPRAPVALARELVAFPVRRQLPPDRDARRHPPVPRAPRTRRPAGRGRSPRTGGPPARARPPAPRAGRPPGRGRTSRSRSRPSASSSGPDATWWRLNSSALALGAHDRLPRESSGDESPVCLVAAAPDQERPRLGVAGRRRPAGGLQHARSSRPADLVGGVVRADAAAVPQQRDQRRRGLGGHTVRAPGGRSVFPALPGVSPAPASCRGGITCRRDQTASPQRRRAHRRSCSTRDPGPPGTRRPSREGISEEYAAELAAAAEKSGVDESLLSGEGLMHGRRVAVVVGEFAFLAGSIGRAAADRLVAAIERATGRGAAAARRARQRRHPDAGGHARRSCRWCGSRRPSPRTRTPACRTSSTCATPRPAA